MNVATQLDMVQDFRHRLAGIDEVYDELAMVANRQERLRIRAALLSELYHFEESVLRWAGLISGCNEAEAS